MPEPVVLEPGVIVKTTHVSLRNNCPGIAAYVPTMFALLSTLFSSKLAFAIVSLLLTSVAGDSEASKIERRFKADF
jgi:hypothetical protein